MTVLDAKPTLKFFDTTPLGGLGSRGGAVRFYMLANGIEFDEDLTNFPAWKSGGKESVTDSINPAGVLPVLMVNDKPYPQHVAICRYLATKTGQYGKDPERDFLADSGANAYLDWSNTLFGLAGKPETDEAVVKYRETRCRFYKTLEWYYAKKASDDSPYLDAGATPGFLDILVFNQMRDDSKMQTPFDATPYPSLKALYEAVGSIEAVKSWVDKIDAAVAAAGSQKAAAA